MKRHLLLVTFVVWCVLLAERSVLAYMDPGSGNMLLQLILGGAAGIALIAKLYWRRFLSVIGLRRRDEPPVPRMDAHGG